MKKFKKLVILDRIILSDKQWNIIKSMTEEIVIYNGLTEQEVRRKLEANHDKSKGEVCFTEFAVEHTTVTELNNRLTGCDAVITCWTNIPDKVLLANPQIKYIGFWTNLVDHRINLVLAKQIDIKVTYIPDYGTIAVAEYVFGIIQEMYRNISRQFKNTIKGNWPYELLKTALYIPNVNDIPYHTLNGKKIGIIGMGRIGKYVAKIAQVFGMEVKYYSFHRKADIEALGIEYCELLKLVKWADIITLHFSPYTIKNSNNLPIISRNIISEIKDGAIFVNTSSGNLADEDALLEEALSGRIRIAMDVYKKNPDRKRLQTIVQKYGDNKNIFTYRGAWLTQESIILKGDSLIRNIKEFLQI